MALAPKPWRRSKSGRVSFLVLGIQQWIVVPSPRSVMVDFRPDFEKDVLRHQFLEAVKLKHFVMDTTQLAVCFLRIITHRENIEALENVVEDEPHFFTEVIDNHLRALTMITKHFMMVADWWSVEVDPLKSQRMVDVGGVENISLTGSKIIANGEDCLDGSDGAGRGEVNGGGVDLGVFNS
ncbi:hypothetical protein Tco_0917775 [Tanacetum coccineum]